MGLDHMESSMFRMDLDQDYHSDCTELSVKHGGGSALMWSRMRAQDNYVTLWTHTLSEKNDRWLKSLAGEEQLNRTVISNRLQKTRKWKVWPASDPVEQENTFIITFCMVKQKKKKHL